MITPIKLCSPAFKQKYKNPDGTIVRVNGRALSQVGKQAEIRNTVENAVRACEDPEIKKFGSKAYFTIFSDGTCKLSKYYKPPVYPLYEGVAKGIDEWHRYPEWNIKEIEAMSCPKPFIQEYYQGSDEQGIVKTSGGDPYARVNPRGTIFLRNNASEVFPE